MESNTVLIAIGAAVLIAVLWSSSQSAGSVQWIPAGWGWRGRRGGPRGRPWARRWGAGWGGWAPQPQQDPSMMIVLVAALAAVAIAAMR